MRVLLDENLSKRLLSLFYNDTYTTTVGQQGWKGVKNGELLALAEPEFDIFVTVDRGIEYQRDVAGLDLVVVLLQAPSNSYPDLAPLMDSLNTTAIVLWRSRLRIRGVLSCYALHGCEDIKRSAFSATRRLQRRSEAPETRLRLLS